MAEKFSRKAQKEYNTWGIKG